MEVNDNTNFGIDLSLVERLAKAIDGMEDAIRSDENNTFRRSIMAESALAGVYAIVKEMNTFRSQAESEYPSSLSDFSKTIDTLYNAACLKSPLNIVWPSLLAARAFIMMLYMDVGAYDYAHATKYMHGVLGHIMKVVASE